MLPINLKGKEHSKAYLRAKLAAVEAALESNREYKQGLENYLKKVDDTIDEINKTIKKKQEARELKKSMGLHEPLSGIDFYKYDKPTQFQPRALTLLRQLSTRKAASEQFSDRRLMSNLSTSSSSESDESDIQLRPEAEDSEDYEKFDSEIERGDSSSALGKRKRGIGSITLQEPATVCKKTDEYSRYFGFPENKKSFEEDQVNQPTNVVVQDITEKDIQQSVFQQNINSIILELKMRPENIRSFNLEEIATKKNSLRHLTKTQMPIFGLSIYTQFRKWHRLDSIENQSWSPAEDKKLTELVEIFGTKKWKQIASFLDGRKAYQCYHRWFKHVCPTKIRQKWEDPLDDVLLGMGVITLQRANGRLRWVKVAELFEGRRTDVQCRERFVNILDPEIEAQMEESIVERVKELYQVYGKKWSKIANAIKCKTDNQVKRIVEKQLLSEKSEKKELSN